MTKTNKIGLYAFIAVIIILLLSVFYGQKNRAQDTESKEPPSQAGDKSVPPPVEPATVQKQLKPKTVIGAANLGKSITVEGLPVNYNTEAAISIKEGNIVWMKGLPPWPSDVVAMGGKHIRVTGVLSEDYGGRAVILDDKGGRQQRPQGHPVPPGTDLKNSNHRFVIINAKWEVIER